MSPLKLLLLFAAIAAIIGIGAGMSRSEEAHTPTPNYDGYGSYRAYPVAAYERSWVAKPSKPEVRDRRASCLDRKTTAERYACMAETDNDD